jgi:glucose-6-phosphate isomerase
MKSEIQAFFDSDRNKNKNSMTGLTGLESYGRLKAHYESQGKGINLVQEFANDPARFSDFSETFEPASGLQQGPKLLVDYSKNLINRETRTLLLELAKEARVEEKRDALFAGDKAANFTEGRAVLHTALRRFDSEPAVLVDGVNVIPDVLAVRRQMRETALAIREGKWLGFTGKRIRSIVNIGIGGSDLGPLMVCEVIVKSDM